MKYIVTLGERELTIEIDGDQVTVDGATVDARVEPVPGTPEVRLVIDGGAAILAVDSREGGRWRLVDQGAVHDLLVENERSRHIRLLGGQARASDGHAVLKAPMPGLVLRILAEVGGTVAAGDPLLALEAMKMENELKAPIAGTITAVHVRAGQAVEKGERLLELGPASGLPQDVVPE